jgi:hypothetical protein
MKIKDGGANLEGMSERKGSRVYKSDRVISMVGWKKMVVWLLVELRIRNRFREVDFTYELQ